MILQKILHIISFLLLPGNGRPDEELKDKGRRQGIFKNGQVKLACENVYLANLNAQIKIITYVSTYKREGNTFRNYTTHRKTGKPEEEASRNSKIKMSRIYCTCISAQTHCSLIRTESVSITIIKTSDSEEETADVCNAS